MLGYKTETRPGNTEISNMCFWLPGCDQPPLVIRVKSALSQLCGPPRAGTLTAIMVG